MPPPPLPLVPLAALARAWPEQGVPKFPRSNSAAVADGAAAAAAFRFVPSFDPFGWLGTDSTSNTLRQLATSLRLGRWANPNSRNVDEAYIAQLVKAH